MSYSDLKLFALSSNKELAEKVASAMGIQLGKSTVRQFSDGEIQVNIEESIRGDHVFILQSTSSPVNDNLMEILIMVDALKRASAEKISVVIPYYGYARQDRKARSREPITSKLVADLLTAAGVHRVVVVDLHAPQIQGFFQCLVDEMTAIPLLATHFKNIVDENWITVSPDHGGVNRARRVAEILSTPLAIIDKRRSKPNEAEVMNIVGDVKGKHCLMVDDMIDTAGSCTEGAKALLKKGALSVSIACSHGIFSHPAEERLFQNDENGNPIFREIVTTDSIPLKEEIKAKGKVVVMSLAPMLAKVIQHIELGQPLTYVYQMFND